MNRLYLWCEWAIVVDTTSPYEDDVSKRLAKPEDAVGMGRLVQVLASADTCSLTTSWAFEPITKGNRFEFHPDRVHDGNHWPCFEYKSRQHRAELVNCQRIVAVQHHIATPVTHSDNEQLDLEIGGGPPFR